MGIHHLQVYHQMFSRWIRSDESFVQLMSLTKVVVCKVSTVS